MSHMSKARNGFITLNLILLELLYEFVKSHQLMTVINCVAQNPVMGFCCFVFMVFLSMRTVLFYNVYQEYCISCNYSINIRQTYVFNYLCLFKFLFFEYYLLLDVIFIAAFCMLFFFLRFYNILLL